MSSALCRGRTLHPLAVKMAKRWQEKHIEDLKKKLADGSITAKEARELRWKWGVTHD